MWVIRVGGTKEGPDILGRDRHRVVLNKLFKERGPVDFGRSGLRPCFGLTCGGPFSKHPILEGVMSVRIYKDGHAGVELGIPEAMELGSEERYRERLIALMRVGAERLVRCAGKKKLEFDGRAFLTLMDEVLAKYASLELPLPPTSAELDLAHRWLGIPQKP